MQGKTHMMVGVASLACLCVAFPQGIQIHGQTVLPQVAGITAAMGSYLPDIDIEQSKLGQKYHFISKHLKHRGFTHTLIIPGILFALLIASIGFPPKYILYFNILLGVICLVNVAHTVWSIVKHGNIDVFDLIHTVCAAYSIIAIIGDFYATQVFASIVFGLFFGWIMHIIADMCNGKGIPLLPGMPHIHIMSVTTGTWQETVWLLVYLAVIILITVKGVFL